jgi:hypothetical protein
MRIAQWRWIQRFRCYSTSNISPLPPTSEWKKVFDANHRNRRLRVCLSNPQTATRVANSLFPPKESVNAKGKVVIEAFPGEAGASFSLLTCQQHAAGPGALTRALLELPTNQIRKLIVLEDIPDYFQRVQVCTGNTDLLSPLLFVHPGARKLRPQSQRNKPQPHELGYIFSARA